MTIVLHDGYIHPRHVTSPRKSLQYMQTLRNDGPYGEAYGMGFWLNSDGSKRRVMLFRYNGGPGHPIGNPQSRGLPVWIVLGDCTHEGVIKTLKDEYREFAEAFFGFD